MATLAEFIERGMQFFSGETVPKSDLAAANAALQAAKADLASTIAAGEIAETQCSQAKADLSTAQQSIKTLTERNAALEAESKSANEKAASMLAGQGIAISKLPAAEPGAAQDKAKELDAVRLQMRTETDPKKKYELAQRARELRGHAGILK